MALSQTLAKTALKVIAKFGRDVTLNATTEGAYDPSSITPTSTAVQSTIKAFIGVYKTIDLKDGLIELGDAPLYTTSKVDKDDTIEFDGKKYDIISVTSYGVNEATVLYVANIRA